MCIKVLHLRSSIGVFGVENVILQLTKELSGTDYRPIIGVFENSQNVHLELAEVARNNRLDTQVFRCRGIIDPRAIWSIRGFVLENNIRIVHAHGYKANLYALMAVVFENIALVATCYPWLETSRSLKHYAWLDKFCLNRFDRILAESEEIKGEVINSGVAASKVSIIENGIDVGSFDHNFDVAQIRKELGIGGDAKVIGTVGRLSEEKGHDVLFRAAKMLVDEFQEIFFIVVGDGPLKEKLQQKAVELNLDDFIMFTGLYPDIRDVLAVIDIFVLPSYTEGLPMALLEAMAAKKPVIATRVGTIPKIIDDKRNGIIISPGDAYALKEEIATLLRYPKKAVELAENGHIKIVNQFSSKQMAEKYVEIYDDLLKK